MSPFRAQPSYAAGVRRIADQILPLPGMTPVGVLPRSRARRAARFGSTHPTWHTIDPGDPHLRHDDPLPDDSPFDRSALTAPTGAASRQRP